MVTTESTPRPYVTIARNGRSAIQLDAPVAKGGGGEGFGSHDLLEASVAVHINIAVRMFAAANGIPLEGKLTPGQKFALCEAARSCPVKETLSRRIEFHALDEAQR